MIAVTLCTTLGSIFFDWFLITYLIPDRSKRNHDGSPLYSYYLSVCVYQPAFIYLGLVAHSYPMGFVNVSAIIIAYAIRDFPNLNLQYHLYFHHIGMIFFTVATVTVSGWPRAASFFTASVLEAESWNKNVVHLAKGTTWFHTCAHLNQAVMLASHIVGIYWCVCMYKSTVCQFFKIFGPLILIPVMILRQFFSYQLTMWKKGLAKKS